MDLISLGPGTGATDLLHPAAGLELWGEVWGPRFWGESRGVGTRLLAPCPVITQLFRFQNKKLEKARKKKEEKKEAMLEKSLFQGGSGAAGWLESPPALAAHGEVGASWSSVSQGSSCLMPVPASLS